MHKDKKIEEISLLKKKLEETLAEEQIAKTKLKNELELVAENVK